MITFILKLTKSLWTYHYKLVASQYTKCRRLKEDGRHSNLIKLHQLMFYAVSNCNLGYGSNRQVFIVFFTQFSQLKVGKLPFFISETHFKRLREQHVSGILSCCCLDVCSSRAIDFILKYDNNHISLVMIKRSDRRAVKGL